MLEIDAQGAANIAGGWSFGSWAISQLVTGAAEYAFRAAASGQLDYAGVAESSGTYYNMMGA